MANISPAAEELPAKSGRTRIIMRLLLLLLALGVIAVIVVVVFRRDAGPYLYHNTRLGVSAHLSEGDWTLVSTFGPEGIDGELYLSNDTRFTFLAGVVSADLPTTTSEMEILVRRVGDGLFVPPFEMGQAEFHSYQSLRLDGTLGLDAKYDDYRMIGHFFIAKSRLYFIMAGSRSSDWERDGKQTVETILNSVSID